MFNRSGRMEIATGDGQKREGEDSDNQAPTPCRRSSTASKMEEKEEFWEYRNTYHQERDFEGLQQLHSAA